MSNKKEELMLLKNAELDVMCKERGIKTYKGKTHITKEAMADAIVEYDNNNPVEENLVPMPGAEKLEELKKEYPDVKEINNPKDEVVNEVKNIPWIVGNKQKEIEAAEVGTLIAFIDEKGKPRTGKLENRSSKRQQIKVVTEFDWTFIVPYDKVLWVRFGNRWPKGVYLMLKEYKDGRKPIISTEEQ